MRRFMNRLLAFGFWLLTFGFLFSSCSTTKNSSSIRSLSANHIIREVEDNRFEFDNMETKFNVKIKGDNNIGLKGQLRMQNDSLIWISVSMKLGIEVGRLMITQDSLKFINKIEKTYFAESLDKIISGQLSAISIQQSAFEFLQDFLVGNDSKIKRYEKYRAAIENDRYKLESKQKNFLAKEVWITPKTFKIKSLELRTTNYGLQSTANIEYDNFQKINGKLLPTKISLKTNGEISLDIEIDYTEIKTGEKTEFPFNISKKYNKITL